MNNLTHLRGLSAVFVLTFVCTSAGFDADAAPKAPSPFRAYDGAGNNLSHVKWGAADIQLLRKTTPSYANKKSKPAGTKRPNARAISNALSTQVFPSPNKRFLTDMFWQWGQFVDHDIDLTPGATPEEAYNIKVPKGDPYFDPNHTGKVKLPFSRSVYDKATGKGKKNPRQQLNKITSFIDASNVYGSSDARAWALRKHDGTGRLLTSHNGRYPPFNTQGVENAGGTGDELFLCGDVRANEQIGLTAMHTIFVREHNRIARKLKKAAPWMTGEAVYQVARFIVGAQMQIITYREFLPLLLGDWRPGPYKGYDPLTNPAIANAFSTVGYRFGHSMVSSTLWRLRANGKPIADGHAPLRDAFFRPWVLVDEGGVDPVIRGLTTKIAQDADLLIVSDLRSFLFGDPDDGGLDLGALNIQRGRDHGLVGYNQMRKDYGLKKLKKFHQISSDSYTNGAIKKAFKKLARVDGWVGVLAEDHLPGAVVGELGAAIIADQFKRLRDGDRFWYQNVLPRPVARLLEKRSTLRGIIARNTNIRAKQLPPWPMTRNPRWKAPALRNYAKKSHGWAFRKALPQKLVYKVLLNL